MTFRNSHVFVLGYVNTKSKRKWKNKLMNKLPKKTDLRSDKQISDSNIHSRTINSSHFAFLILNDLRLKKNVV